MGNAIAAAPRGGKAAQSGVGVVDAPGGVNISCFAPQSGFMNAIGKGGFGLVAAMVLKDDPDSLYAVKIMNKCKILVRDLVKATMHELVILKSFSRQHLNLVNLHFCFQDKRNLYAVLDLCVGGSVAHALSRMPTKRFSQSRARHYMVEIVIGIRFLHSERICHRDIKPDNLLIDADGRIRITDFNVSMRLPRASKSDQPHADGWGTRGYRAPEIYVRKGAGYLSACDWWSAGATLYEMLTGALPYPIREDEAPVDMLRRVYAGDLDVSECGEAGAILRELLVFDPKDRLGDATASKHAYFAQVNWIAFEKGQIPAPWIPRVNPVDPETLGPAFGEEVLPPENVASSLAAGNNPFAPAAEAAPSSAFLLGTSTTTTTAGPASPSTTSPAAQGGQGNEGGLPALSPPASPLSESLGSSVLPRRSLAEYAHNFDATLDDRERYRMIESNLRQLGFGADDDAHDSDEEFNDNEPTPEQQALFAKWSYNAHVPRPEGAADDDDEWDDWEDRLPQFATLLSASALPPAALRKLVATSSDETLAQLCAEMRQVHEAFITENFRHLAAELRADALHQRLQSVLRADETPNSAPHTRG